MVILHVACIEDNNFSGVCVAVPQHVKEQAQHAVIGFLNVNNIKIKQLDCQLEYKKSFDIKFLPKPFDKPDLVVFHEAYRVQYLCISANLRKNKIPYIIVPHGELRKEAQKKKWLKKKVANFLLFNRFINGAVAVQCLSELEQEATLFGKKKFIGTNGIAMPATQKETFREKGAHFVYIGRLDMKVKGLDLMLEAVRLKADFLRANYCSLQICGPDTDRAHAILKELIREKQIEDLVCVKGGVVGEEKEKILLNGDVFIQTSRHEGMSMGILEALSYGLPCLVTRGTNLGEEVESADAGWMAENDAESIAEALEKTVLAQPEWVPKSKNAKKYAERNYAWNVIARDTVCMYKKLLE